MKAARLAALAACTFLVGCEKESAKALRQAQIVEGGIDEDAKCEAKQKVAAAFLKEEDRDSYSLYKSAADGFCLGLELRRRNGLPDVDLSDNMTAIPS
jgi:hypothetical protein